MRITLQGGPADGDVIEISDDCLMVKFPGDPTMPQGWLYTINRRTGTATYDDATVQP